MYIKNFITLLRRYTTSSLLNVVGMAIAFASVYLILVQVNHDLLFNRALSNSERIYRVEKTSADNLDSWSYYWNQQLPDKMCASIPEIESAGTLNISFPEEYIWYDHSIKRNQTIDNLRIKLSYAEPKALEVFSYDFIEGGLENFVTVNDVIISEDVAKKYDLKVGDVLTVGRGLATKMTRNVVGIYKNLPKPNSISECEGWSCDVGYNDENSWGKSFYVRLKEGTSSEEVAEKMRDIALEYWRDRDSSNDNICVRLNPITNLYLDDTSSMEGSEGNRTTTYSLIVIAVLILVISFINFVNFFFALIPTRIKSINTYKVFGAPTSKLRLNILMETLGLTMLSVLLAAIIVFAFANTPLSGYISTSVALKENWYIALAIFVILMILAALISLYPAFYITKFNPSLVLKGSFHATKSGKILRYSLVGIQYVISISLIICTLFIQRQHNYMLKHELGFDKEMLYIFKMPQGLLGNGGEMDYSNRDAITEMLKQNPNIIDVAYGDGRLVDYDHMTWSRDYKDGFINFRAFPVSWNFLQMMGIKIEEGRDFMPSDENTNGGALIFNRAAVDKYGLDIETFINAHGDVPNPVVGICEDFNFQPLHKDINPWAFVVFGQYGWRYPKHVYLRVAAGTDFKEIDKFVKDIFEEIAWFVAPETYELKFFDDELAIQYQTEDKLSTLVTMFSVLSIVISIIGVFGLVLFETQYKRHEIGIRRVHGASSVGIIKMFNRKYLYIVAICSVIAIPISYFIIDRWMQQFAYRCEMSLWVYAVAVAAVAIITMATVTIRSWKAANENPVEAL